MRVKRFLTIVTEDLSVGKTWWRGTDKLPVEVGRRHLDNGHNFEGVEDWDNMCYRKL